MGAKALLAKKMAKGHNPAFISPTDKLMTPVTQKLSAARKKHFTKGSKPVQLFAQKEHEEASSNSDSEAIPADQLADETEQKMEVSNDDENPF
ncbi:hypothetical protein BD779DRAFT_1667470 [Infundibulicybe gibba]|nr:hypothetical protein BD779DRAFT_1667470 [Infundibulicybe gibba]